jgi:hypothetical protein
MKAQLKVGGGNGDLPSIPGITAAVNADSYAVDWTPTTWAIVVVFALLGFALPLLVIMNAATVKASVLKLCTDWQARRKLN